MISTDFKRGNTGRRTQRGLATLFVSVILLFLATILALMVARATMMEQRMSAN
jgi:Tfp pilus assembly protein PilX